MGKFTWVPPARSTLRGRTALWLMVLLCSVQAMAAPKVVNEVWGSYEDTPGTIWHSTSGSGPLANGDNDLLAFKVAGGGAVYGTGVNNAAVLGSSGSFKAFNPSVVPASGGLNAIAASSDWTTAPSPRASFLSDGGNGLNLMTAIFNVPTANLTFSATLSNATALTDGVPDIVVTQVGQPAAANGQDTFYFIDSGGNIVGNSVSLSFAGITPVGRQQWQFRNPDGSPSGQGPGPRDLRVATLDLNVDFGITSANMAQVVGFVQHLSGESDIAFVAYNENAIGVPALDLTKTAIVAGDQSTITYRFSVTNTGQTVVNNITLSDPGLSGLACSTVTSLAVGATANFTCTGNVYAVTPADLAAGQRINNATVTGKDPSNRDVPANAQATALLPNANLGITKTANNPNPYVGDNVTFTITVNNAGPSDAAGVSVADALPAGYTLVSATPSTGTWTAPNWTIGSLANGASATLMVVATVNAAGPYANTATVSAITQDPDPGNNNSTATPVPVASADLAITKTVDNNKPVAGSIVSFTVTVTNTGLSDAAGVNVVDVLPAGYALVSATPSMGTWNAPNWAIGSLAKGASATMTMVASVHATGPYANTATVRATTRDPNLGNNTATAAPETVVPVPNPVPVNSPWALAMVALGLMGVALRLKRN